MKNENQLNHDILNLIERLRIMHDLINRKNFEDISKDEIKEDLDETLNQLKTSFEQLIQY